MFFKKGCDYMEKNTKKYYALKILAQYPQGVSAKQIVKEHEKELQNYGFNTRGKDGGLITNSLNATIACMCKSANNTSEENIFVKKEPKKAMYEDNVYTLYTINANGLAQIEEENN